MTDDISERHRARMERRKEVVDQKIDAAKRDAGVLLVNTGNGKGKSSSAFGMAIRALLVSAITSGQGKTTVTAALARKLRRQGLRVSLFSDNT